MGDEVKRDIEARIAANPIMVFSKPWCPFCTKAKDAIEGVVGDKFTVLELETEERESATAIATAADYQDAFKELTGARSVPRVFFQGRFIGGGDDAVAIAKSGQLEQMAVKAGLIAARSGGGVERFFSNGKLVAGAEEAKW